MSARPQPHLSSAGLHHVDQMQVAGASSRLASDQTARDDLDLQVNGSGQHQPTGKIISKAVSMPESSGNLLRSYAADMCQPQCSPTNETVHRTASPRRHILGKLAIAAYVKAMCMPGNL